MGIVRGILTLVGVGTLLCALVVSVARYLPVVNHSVLIAALAAPIAVVAAPAAVLGFALAGRWALTAVAVVVTVVIAAVVAPSFVSAQASGVAVRVMSMNMEFGAADAAEIVQLAKRDVDVLAVQEMTPKGAARLSAAGLDEVLPHRNIDPRPGASGIGLWSRFPLTDTARVEAYRMPAVIGRVEIPGVAVNPAVASIHLMPPWPPPVQAWRADMAVLPTTLAELAQMAAEQAGVPFAPTYPADRFTPVITIDHVLTRNATGTGVQTVRVPGTDHMALIVDVALGDAVS